LDSKGDYISGAQVVIEDFTNNEIFNGTSDGGAVLWISTTEYIQDQVSTIIYTPHNISASKDGYTIFSDPYMNKNKEVILTFSLDLPISVPTGLNVIPIPEGNALNISWDPNLEDDLTGYILYLSTDNVTYDIEVLLSKNITFYIDLNLTDGENYYYKISATNATNKSELSESVLEVPKDIQPPHAPANLTVKKGTTDDSLQLFWDPVDADDLLGYIIYRSMEIDDDYEFIQEVGLQTQFTDSALEEYSTYYYKITAVDEVPNESDFSDIAGNTTWDLKAPDAPENLVITVVESGNTLNLSWSEVVVDDIYYYTVYISTDAMTFNFKATVSKSPNPFYLDDDLTDGIVYYYRVTASDFRPNESPFSDAAFGVPVDEKPPRPPTDLLALPDINPETLELIWGPSTSDDVMGYNIYRSLSSGGPYEKIATIGPVTYYTDTNLQNGTRYFYRVNAFDEVPNNSSFSNEVNATSLDTIPPETPSNLNVTALSSGNALYISWDANTEVDLVNYTLYRSINNISFDIRAKVTAQTEYYIDSGLIDGTTYYYRISASDEAPNESPLSEIVSGVPKDTLAPARPVGFWIINGTTLDSLLLTWVLGSEADLVGYNIFRSNTSGGPYTFIANVSIVSEYEDIGLESETTYYYVIQAFDEIPNNSTFSLEASKTTRDTIPPSIPTNLTVTTIPTGNSLNITWDAAPELDVVNYTLYFSTDNITFFEKAIIPLGTEYYIDAGLIDGNTYYYMVLASDEEPNNSPLSSVENGTPYDIIAPSTPMNFTVTDQEDAEGALNISWDPVSTNADGSTCDDLVNYYLYSNKTGVWEQIAVLPPQSTSYVDNQSIVDNLIYYYRIAASDEVPNQSPQSNITGNISLDDLPPSTPSGLSVSAVPGAEGSLNISWDPNTEVDLVNYTLYSNKTGVWLPIVNISFGTEYYIDNVSITDGSTYYYKVSASDEVPNESPKSDVESSISEDDLSPATPTGLRVEDLPNAEGVLNISWEPVTTNYDGSPCNDLAIYTLYSNKTGLWIKVTTLSFGTTYYLDNISVEDGIKYYYRLSSSDEVPNESPISGIVGNSSIDDLSPKTPANFLISEEPNTEGTLNISWSQITENIDNSVCFDLEFYSIYSNKTGVWMKVTDVPKDMSFYLDKVGIADGEMIYYRITASDEVPNESPQSLMEENISLDDLSPATPTNLDAKGTLLSGELNITWDAVVINLDGTPCTDLVNYTLYRNGSTPGTWVFVANLSSGTEYYLDSGLADDIVYNYTISASDEVPNISPLAEPNSGIPNDATPPAQPTGFSVSNEPNSEGSLNLSWDPNSEDDLSHYLIYSNRSGIWEMIALVSVGSEYYVDFGLTDGIVYYYNISAYDYSSNEGLQTPSESNFSIDDIGPSIPQGFIVKDLENSESSLNISWDPVITNQDGSSCIDLLKYSLYSNKSGAWQLVAEIPASIEYYIDNISIVDDITLYYRVSASDEIPNISPNTTANGNSKDDLSPTTPSGFTVSDIANAEGSLNITWMPVTQNEDGSPLIDLVSYSLYSNKTGSWIKIADIPAGTNYYVDEVDIMDGSVYYYIISASDEVPNESLISKDDYNFSIDDLSPATPQNLEVIDFPNAQGSLFISWDSVVLNTDGSLCTDLSHYSLYRNDSGSWVLVENISLGITFYLDEELVDGILYNYSISASDEVPNESPISSVVSNFPLDDLAPATPTGFTVNNVIDSQGSLNISWNANIESDLVYYTLYSNKTGIWFPITSILADTEFYIDSVSIIDGIRYYYRLTASDEVPNESSLYAEANGVSFDNLAPVIPTGFTVIPLSEGNGLEISWDANSEPDLVSYTLFISINNITFDVEAVIPAGTEYYTDLDLIDGVTYYYMIIASDEVPNNSPNSIIINEVPSDTEAPAPPAGINTFTGPNVLSVFLTWDQNTELDLKGYLVLRSMTSGGPYTLIATLGKVTKYLVSGLSADTTYFYVIAAYDEVPNNSSFSNEANFSTPDIVPPSAPTGLSITVIPEGNSLNITWLANPEPDVEYYSVYRSTEYQSFIWIANVIAGTEFFIDYGLTDGVTYYYLITASDEVPNVSPLSDVVQGIPLDTIAPESPTNLNVISGPTTDQLILIWNASTSSDVKGYKIYRSTTQGGPYNLVTTVGLATSFLDLGLTPDTAYYYVVSAIDEVPHESSYSNEAYSYTPDTISPSTPEGVTLEVVAEGSALNISWDPVVDSDLISYILFRSLDNVTFVRIAKIVAGIEYYLDTNLKDGTTYYYLLKAQDEIPNESNSSIIVEGIPQDILAPQTPTNLKATKGIVPGSVKLSWDENPEDDLVGYTLYYSKTSGGPYDWLATLGPEISYHVFDLEDDVTYYFVIGAYDEIPQNSTISWEVQYTTVDSTPPQAPTGLMAFPVDGGGAVYIVWNHNTEGDLDHYTLYVGNDNVTFIWLVNLQAGINEFTHSGLINNVEYFYIIAAFDEVPNKSPMSNIASAIPQEEAAPSIPTGLKVTPIEGTMTLNISWNPSPEPDLDHYVLYRSEDNVTFVWIANISADMNYYVDDDVEAGRTNYYKLSAVDSNMFESELSEAVFGVPSEGVTDEKDFTGFILIGLVLIIVLILILLLLLKRKKREEEVGAEDEEKDVKEIGEEEEPEEDFEEEEDFKDEGDEGKDEQEEEESVEDFDEKEGLDEPEDKEDAEKDLDEEGEPEEKEDEVDEDLLPESDDDKSTSNEKKPISDDENAKEEIESLIDDILKDINDQ
jgi:fibronectin type 3 domain-containing protein